ncbi:MAG: hypothetical protein Q9226_004399 [Calogaya cf. arnoldii]
MPRANEIPMLPTMSTAKADRHVTGRTSPPQQRYINLVDAPCRHISKRWARATAASMSQSNNSVDIELAQSPSRRLPSTPRLPGYPSFAHFISQDGDAAIYRKYESLSARNLLYLQSELHELEGQLEEIDAEDAKNKVVDDQESQKIARLWHHYARADNGRAIRHRKLQVKIRAKIKEYRTYMLMGRWERIRLMDGSQDEALVLESRVLTLSAPTPRSLALFKRWYLHHPLPVLWGRDKDLFRNEQDLVALAPIETDRLNIFLQKYLGWFLKEKRQSSTEEDLFYFPARRVHRAGAVISIFLSAVLLIGAIVCLVNIDPKDTILRVGMIVLFTCLFAAVVGLLTNARRAEIFASTAAYAAVLCVFMNNNT